MATLRVTEIALTGAVRLTQFQAPKIKGAVQNPVTFTGTAGRSLAFGSTTRLIRVQADAACAVKVGDSTVTAVATDTVLNANTPEYFDVDPGDFISAITLA